MIKGILTGVSLGAIVSMGLATAVSVMVPVGQPVDVAVQGSNEDTMPNPSKDGAIQPAPLVADTLTPVKAPVVLAQAPELDGVEASGVPVTVKAPSLPKEAPQIVANVLARPAAPALVPNMSTIAPAPEPIRVAASTDQNQPEKQADEVIVAATEVAPQVDLPADDKLALVAPVAPKASPLKQPQVGDAGGLDRPAQIDAAPVTPVAADQPVQPRPAVLALAEPQEESAPVIRTDPASTRRTQGVSTPQPQGDAMTAPQQGRVGIGKPAGSLIGRAGGAKGVRVNRPGAAEEKTEQAAAPAQETTEPAVKADLPPLSRFAQAFENPGDKPLMGIIMVDEGANLQAETTGVSALKGIGYPVTIAVDSRLPDAKDRMVQYRKDGFEVLAMIDLPRRARATDAEVAMSVTLDSLNEVIGVLDGDRNGLQPSRDAAQQVAAALSESGHGVITRGQGLNSLARLADKEGVPAREVFRDLDIDNQDALAVRRALDQASFKARQQGAVVLLGRIRPETMKALQSWGQAERAEQVAMAPVSALLLATE